METEKMNKKKRSITKAVIISLAIIGALVGLVFLILEGQRREKRRKMEELVEIGVKNTDYADTIAYYFYKIDEPEKADKVIRNGAERGNAVCQYMNGNLYSGWRYSSEEGWSYSKYYKYEDKDFEKSSYWFLQSALQGYSSSEVRLGLNYWAGEGVEQDFYKALTWIKRSAIQHGNSWALRVLGDFYDLGLAYYGWDDDGNLVWPSGYTEKDNKKINKVRFNKGDIEFCQKNSNIYAVFNSRSQAQRLFKSSPKYVYLKRDVKKAKKYWGMAADKGDWIAKERLQKIYEGDDE